MIRHIVSLAAFLMLSVAAGSTVLAFLDVADFVRMAFLDLPSAMHPKSSTGPLHLAFSVAFFATTAAIHARFAFILVVPPAPDMFDRKMDLQPGQDQATAPS